FYGVSSLMKSGVIGLVVSFLLFTSALVGQWAWKRYAIVSMSLGLAFALAYFAFRPEMIRDDVLSQLRTPALTVDLVFYRGIALRGDSAREAKIDRLNYAYGFFKTLVSPEAILPEASGESLSEDPR